MQSSGWQNDIWHVAEIANFACCICSFVPFTIRKMQSIWCSCVCAVCSQPSCVRPRHNHTVARHHLKWWMNWSVTQTGKHNCTSLTICRSPILCFGGNIHGATQSALAKCMANSSFPPLPCTRQNVETWIPFSNARLLEHDSDIIMDTHHAAADTSYPPPLTIMSKPAGSLQL